uniref:Uncharacterized protein n=1 Tax=Schistocephalus solidus TaxID=70667 RepID=A0A0X3PKT9_SCHSO
MFTFALVCYYFNVISKAFGFLKVEAITEHCQQIPWDNFLANMSRLCVPRIFNLRFGEFPGNFCFDDLHKYIQAAVGHKNKLGEMSSDFLFSELPPIKSTTVISRCCVENH